MEIDPRKTVEQILAGMGMDLKSPISQRILEKCTKDLEKKVAEFVVEYARSETVKRIFVETIIGEKKAKIRRTQGTANGGGGGKNKGEHTEGIAKPSLANSSSKTV